MLNNLQALRAFAALAVVWFHFTLMKATALPVHGGGVGVDLFFVLSGFIIPFSADKSARHFLAHRLIRVLPPYWIATLIVFVLAALPPARLADAAGWLVQSLLFLSDPRGRPIMIFVGWTLVYELFFYLVYSVLLAVSRRAAPYLSLIVLAASAAAMWRFGFPVNLPQPMHPWPLAEFGLGVAIFILLERYDVGAAGARWPGLALVFGGLFMLFALEPLFAAKNGASGIMHVLMQGIPAALVVWGLLAMENAGWRTRSRVVLLVGDASYAIYLLHPIAVGILMMLAPGDLQHRLIVFAVAMIATVAVSLLFYRFVERPVIRNLRRVLTGDGPPVTG